ncbi:MAG: hypothetical protein NUV84_01875 [Candidatus Uhrbacteria bacterium]|nr:hypothetical protein [Candidatus Uhrbacteria bacterium]
MKRLTLLFFALALALTPGTSFAYNSNICASPDGCTLEDVGPFMQDISQGCGNLGDCTLEDILTVFVNVGNYVVGIIGAVVLLMYVVGGFYWLASAGRKEWVDKGKKYMTISTIGLLIVMFSYLAILALRSAITTGTITQGGFVVCTGSGTAGANCDVNAVCDATGFVCEYK